MMADQDFDTIVASVVTALRDGQVVVIPTDTVYGLAADPTSPTAMARLFELKQRPDGVPVAVLVGSTEQARGLVKATDGFETLATAHWPGALTMVANGLPEALDSVHLGDVATIGVRLPDHDLIRACADAFGPIAATSANRHGEPTIVDPVELKTAFGSDVNLIIDGGVLDGTASTVADITTHPPTVLRQGVVHLDQTS